MRNPRRRKPEPPEPAPQDYQAKEKIKNRSQAGYDQRPDEELCSIETRPQPSERETTTTRRDLSAPEKARRQQLYSLHEKKEIIAKGR